MYTAEKNRVNWPENQTTCTVNAQEIKQCYVNAFVRWSHSCIEKQYC